MRLLLLTLPLALLVVACQSNEGNETTPATANPPIQQVFATAETGNAPSNDDAADDPAIFIHPDDRSKSAIIATDKQYGLLVYDLAGQEVQRFPVGATNNVDLRQGCLVGGDTLTLVAASNRTFNGLSLFTFDHDTYALTPLIDDTLVSNSEEVYGCTMYLENGQPYIFIIGKDGLIEQWSITGTNREEISANIVRTLQVPTQPEGGVVDDVAGLLYVGEEEAGVWQFNAHPTASSKGKRVISIADHAALAADIEGIALYTTPNVQYLVVSSQGNHTYAIFTTNDFSYVGSFEIPFGEEVDGAEETDGLEATAASLGRAFPNGLLVVQDGFNDGTQNFKYIDWADVANAFSPALVIDPQ